jgi:hypothetical protein
LAKGLTQAMSPTKRWLRISLRTSFVLFTCVAIAVGWFARYANQRWAAFAALRQAGADIQMGVGEPSRLEDWFGAELFGTVNKVDLREGKADNKLMVRIAALQELRRLDLSNADIDDDGLRLIKHLPLRELWLQETKISDASAKRFPKSSLWTFCNLTRRRCPMRFLNSSSRCPNWKTLDYVERT